MNQYNSEFRFTKMSLWESLNGGKMPTTYLSLSMTAELKHLTTYYSCNKLSF